MPILFSFFNFSAPAPNPVELGKVNWLRDYDQAIQTSIQTGKPILILFQEVPGCRTCRQFGEEVLSHPLIVDAIETYFVPLAIYNNTKEDDKVLKKFKEPSWNNPVVRIVDASSLDLTDRMANYSSMELIAGIEEVLNAKSVKYAPWFDLLKDNFVAKTAKTEQATFGMYCFWTGEAKLGSIDGVVATKPGFMNGHEVVEVEYNPAIITYADLTTQAKANKCSSKVFVHNKDQKKIATTIVDNSAVSSASNFRLDKDVKYYLSKTDYRIIPMMENQATMINAFLATQKDIKDLLSPSQWRYYKQMQSGEYKKVNRIGAERLEIIWDAER